MVYLVKVRFIKSKNVKMVYSDKEYLYCYDNYGFLDVPNIGDRARILSTTGNNYSNSEVEIMNIQGVSPLTSNYTNGLVAIKSFDITERYYEPIITREMVVSPIKDNSLTRYSYFSDPHKNNSTEGIHFYANTVRELQERVEKVEKVENTEKVDLDKIIIDKIKSVDVVSNTNGLSYNVRELTEPEKTKILANSVTCTLVDKNDPSRIIGLGEATLEITQEVERVDTRDKYGRQINSFEKGRTATAEIKINSSNMSKILFGVGHQTKSWCEEKLRIINDDKNLWTIPENDKPLKVVFENNNTINGKKEGNIMTDLFKGLGFGQYNGNFLKPSIKGMAYRNTATNTYVAYDKDTKSLVDVGSFLLNIDAIYKIPVAIKDISAGDVVIHNSTPFIVTEIIGNKIKAIEPQAGEVKELIPFTNIFGFNFYTKVVNIFDGMINGSTASEDNPFGNMLPLMLLSGNSGNDNLMETMLMMNMMNGTNSVGGINPMMMMMLMKDGDNKDMLPLMMMMMNGGFNFGMAPASMTSVPTTPVTNTGDKEND